MLCTPKYPEEEMHEELRTTGKLNKQFGVKKLILAEHYQFYSYKQQGKQSLVAYLYELRRLASTCQWAEAALSEIFMISLQWDFATNVFFSNYWCRTTPSLLMICISWQLLLKLQREKP